MKTPLIPHVVIGTGLSGLAQAWAMARHQISVTLVGPMPPMENGSGKKDERTTAILMPGIRYLQALDLWDDIKDSATPLVTMELIDDQVHSIFDASEINEDMFGYNISNAALKDALVTRLSRETTYVIWHKDKAIQLHQSDHDWTINLESGATLHAGFVIGAEGRHSPTRDAAGIAINEEHIDQVALVTILEMEKPHHNTSVEWYFKGGPLTLVPMQKNRMAVVWCNSADSQAHRLSAPVAEIEQELMTLTGHRFGQLKVAMPLQSWPVTPICAKQLVQGNCALIGEAAHVLPPLCAQGFNTSLHDIMALTAVLDELQKLGLPAAHNPLLRRYETTRMPEITMRYRSINTLNYLLRSPSSVMHGMRRLALRGIGRVPFLKNHLMHAGMTQRSEPRE